MIKLAGGEYLGTRKGHYQTGGVSLVDTVYHRAVFNGWHSHEHAHLTLVLDGGNREQRRRGEEQLAEGRVVFYHSDEMHRNDHTLLPSRNLNLEISSGFFEQYGLTEQDFARAVHKRSILASKMIRVFKEAVHAEHTLADEVSGLLAETTAGDQRLKAPDWVNKLRELLHDNWTQTYQLHQLSDILGVHPITISKHFSRYFGCTLSSYMRKLKIERAIPLLRRQEPLPGIAYYCGFADQSHFIRTFKAETGFLPSAFKKV